MNSRQTRQLRRRQEKARRRQQEKKERLIRQKHSAEKKSQRVVARAAASGAFGMPALFRSLKLEGEASFDQHGLKLAGLDLQLFWHQSQELRASGDDTEPVSSLQVDTCRRLLLSDHPAARNWADVPELQIYRCSGRLAEHVDENCIYGQWLRMQAAQGDFSDDEPYVEIEIDFDIVIGRATKRVIRLLEPRLMELQPVRFVHGKLNVIDISVIDRSIKRMSELQVDRWYEFTAALKLLIPRSQGPCTESMSESYAALQLKKIGQEEVEIAGLLKLCAEHSVRAWQECQHARGRSAKREAIYAEDLKAAENNKEQTAESLKQAQEEILRLQAAKREAESLVLSGVRHGEREATVLRYRAEAEQASVRLAELEAEVTALERELELRKKKIKRVHREHEWQVVAAKKAVLEAEEELRRARLVEAPVSKRFEFAFIRREAILADMRWAKASAEAASRAPVRR